MRGLSTVNPNRTPLSIPEAARRFNLVVAGLVFLLMLAFAGWVVASAAARTGGSVNLARALAGAFIGGGALTLLAAVRAEWRSGEPFQHSRMAHLGLALFGAGATVLGIALTA